MPFVVVLNAVEVFNPFDKSCVGISFVYVHVDMERVHLTIVSSGNVLSM